MAAPPPATAVPPQAHAQPGVVPPPQPQSLSQAVAATSPLAQAPAPAVAPAAVSPPVAAAPQQAAAPAGAAAAADDSSSSSDSDAGGASNALSHLSLVQEHATPPAPSADPSNPNDSAADHPLIKARSGCFTPNVPYNARLFEKMRASLAQCSELTRATASSMPGTFEAYRARRDGFFTERSAYKSAKGLLKLAKKEQKRHDRYFRFTVLGQANTDRYNGYLFQRNQHNERKEAMERKEKEWAGWLSRENDWHLDNGGWTTWVKERIREDDWKKLQAKWYDSKKDHLKFLKDQEKLKEERKLWDETVAPAWIQWEQDIGAERAEWTNWRNEYEKEKKLTKPMKKQHKDDTKMWMDRWAKLWAEHEKKS